MRSIDRSRLYHAAREVRTLGVEVPSYIEADISTDTIAAILDGGCESGSYMPAVTYSDALETMARHGDDVIGEIEGAGCEIPTLADAGSWASLACALVSLAVEVWASRVVDDVIQALDYEDDGEDEDEGEDAAIERAMPGDP